MFFLLGFSPQKLLQIWQIREKQVRKIHNNKMEGAVKNFMKA
jgi:hypothetical protein